MVPLEFCTVPRGQIMRKEIPDDKVKDVLEFSTKKPSVRLQCIKDGLQVRYLISIRFANLSLLFFSSISTFNMASLSMSGISV